MPKDLVKLMEEKAKKNKAKIVVCEGWEERCLKAVDELIKGKMADFVLLGDAELIENNAKKFKVDISKATITDPENSDLADELAKKLFELRKNKGMTMEKAKELLKDENYFACMYVYAGYADCVVGSAVCATADFMRPALQILRKKDGLASIVWIIFDPKRKKYFFMSDTAMNIDPGAEELAKISLNAAEVVKDFDLTPKVALLSFSTKGSGGDSSSIQKIRDAVEIVKKRDPGLLIDGELQFDAAISEYGCERKCPDSPLKGDANVIIFPDLTSGNILSHGLMQFSYVKFMFSVLKGMEKPVSALGRTIPLETLRNMMVVCAMRANKSSSAEKVENN
jgi:phosphate acetyltransferase